MAKIPSKTTMAAGVKVLRDVYKEIDKQIGAEANTTDGKVSDAEVATFLRQRGARSDTAGAAVATFTAYMRHFADDGNVAIDAIDKTLKKVTGYVERDREKGLEVAQMKGTWRAIALFAQEVKEKGLTAKDIVADRTKRPVGDLALLQPQLDVMRALLTEIGQRYGSGDVTVDAVKRFIAEAPATVATAKEAVRTLTRYLENRTRGTTFSAADVDGAFETARAALKKNAAGANDRAQLASTWQALLAFADENIVRKKDAQSIAGAPAATAPTPTAPAAAGGPRAGSVSAFRALDVDVKREILEDYGNLHGHYVTTGEKKIEELTGKAREYADKMRKELLSLVGDFEEDSGVYGTIGGPVARAEVISLPNGDVVGGRVWLFQKGFNADTAPPDANGDTPYHFDTAADCRAAGIDADEDISWQVHGLFETAAGGGAVQLGESYEHVDDHWEWSGY